MEVERLAAIVENKVVAASRGPCARIKCKEIKARLDRLQGEAMVTPSVSSRYRVDAEVRTKILDLETLVGRLEGGVVTARAKRRESDVLNEELKAARMELKSMTGTANEERLRAEDLSTKLERQSERYMAGQATVVRISDSLGVTQELCRHLKREVFETKESALKVMTDANAKVTEVEQRIALVRAEKQALATRTEAQQQALKTKGLELERIRKSASASLRWEKAREEKSIDGDQRDRDWYDKDLENAKPNTLSPGTKARRIKMLQRRRKVEEGVIDHLYETIGEEQDPTVLAKVLEMTDNIDALMNTKQFWERRITQGQELIDTINEDWDATRSARIKADYLLSDRDLQAMRVDWSCVLVNNKPRPKVALANPFKPEGRVVLFPEPITKKSRVGGWADEIKGATAHFGLISNPDHRDATERDFDTVVQQLINRDAHLLPSHEDLGGVLNGVIGFDGAADFCHSCIRLIDYIDGVAKESEQKGAGLTVAVGDDHNFNLNLQFRRVGPAINRTISTGGMFTLRGMPIRLAISTCLDYSASRSMYGMRSNSSPHSAKLHPHLIVEVKADAAWGVIDTAIDVAMPWCPRPSQAPPRNHLFNEFPAKCKYCSYTVGSEAEQDANIAVALAMRSVKTKAGKVAWAARVKVFCEAHEECMEFESAVLDVDPSDNIVDLLHAIHINIPNRIANFSFHDAVNFAADPELKHALNAYYMFINCPFDLNGDKTWWHGAMWCYNFVKGANKESPGLDINILMCCLIVFGTDSKSAAGKDTAKAPAVVDDLPCSSAPKKKKAKKAPLDPLMQILKPLFGSNAEKVRSIFESWTSYAEVFMAIHDKWESSSTEYKEERASRLYRAGIACLLTPPHPDVVLGCDRAPSRKRGCARVNLPAFGWNGCPPSDLPIQIRSPNPDPIPIRRSTAAQGGQDYVQ